MKGGFFLEDIWTINHIFVIINLAKEATIMKNEILIYNLPEGNSNVERKRNI